MADRFYTPQLLPPGEFVLDGAEGHHLATVRRFAPGDRVVLFNGDGSDYPAEIVAVSKKSAVLIVGPPLYADREVGFDLVVASALPKGDRADFLIEKLTELGATRFVPLITARSVVVPKASTVEKFSRAVIEASKQCGRNVLMQVDEPARWNDFLKRTDPPPGRYALHTSGSNGRIDRATVKDGVIVAVGPEGGFTSEEVDEASRMGWKEISLGTRILRIETAAIAAVSILI